MKKSIIFVIFLLLLKVSIAATIHGIVYDTSLLPIDKAVIEINTEPKQTIVTQNGQYSFNVPIGEYIITAKANLNDELYIETQNISVKDDGDYIIDLILFPEMEDFEDELDFDIEPFIEERKQFPILWMIIPLIIIFLITLFLIKSKKKEPKEKIIEEPKEGIKEEKEAMEEKIEDDEELNKIYNMIKEAKRITQKDIRKQTGLSEAKISLVISQLESEGKIKKIKKGRTNIIIIK